MKRFKFHTGDWLMLSVALIWGLNFPIIKVALKEIPPLPYNGIRLLLSALVLVVWLKAKGENFKIQAGHGKKIILLALTGHTIYQYIFILGIHWTTASNTAVLFGTAPVLISLFSSFYKHEKIKPLAWMGILTAFTGVYIVISGKSGGFRFSSTTLKGDILILTGIALWAFYTVSSRPLLKVYSPLKFTTLTLTLGAVLFFPLTVKQVAALPYAHISPTAWICLVYSGIGALALALIIWFYSVKRVGNSQTAVYGNLPPVFAVFFSYLILSEAITLSLVAGAAVIVTGIFFTRRGHREAVNETI